MKKSELSRSRSKWIIAAICTAKCPQLHLMVDSNAKIEAKTKILDVGGDGTT